MTQQCILYYLAKTIDLALTFGRFSNEELEVYSDISFAVEDESSTTGGVLLYHHQQSAEFDCTLHC
jgi:hypothetical protein